MTDLDLDAIEARANAASDGPWIVVHEPAWEADDVQHPDVIKVGAPLYVGDDEPVTVCLVSTDYEDDPVDVLGDAEFIAHARTDVPALVAALREARAEVERLRDDLSTAVRGLDAYVGANGASVAERDDWRRRYEALRADYNHLNERLDFAVDCPDCGAHGFITDGRWRG